MAAGHWRQFDVVIVWKTDLFGCSQKHLFNTLADLGTYRVAQAKGKRLGRPRRVVDASGVAALRASGASWRAISREMGLGLATLYRATAT
jgi:DNA invertase Pin-like site-specific DNA recombinase